MSQMPKSLTRFWSARVLYELARAPNGLRFNALERAINAPSSRMLSQLLQKLARDGVVIRTVINQIRRRIPSTR